MQIRSSWREHCCTPITATLFLICTAAAHGTDSYNSSNGQLTIPSVTIGVATYSNVVVNVGNIVRGPTGTVPYGTQDSYNPASRELTIPAVTDENTTYYNVVITVAGLKSIGGVSDADSYNGAELSIPYGQVGNTIYKNVLLTPGGIVKVGSGMPTVAWDTYDAAMGQLNIPVVQFGGNLYTNIVITVRSVGSVGGMSGIASQSAIISDAPLGGLAYVANPSGTAGTTDALGEFSYAPDDSVTFSVAGISLGTATGLSTTSTKGNPSVITPISLVPGATSATDPTVTAIGQLLGALNSVSVAVGEGNLGAFVIPTATGLSGTPAATVTTLLNTLNSSGITAATLATAVGPGGTAQTAIVNAGGTVPAAASAQANITQGVNAASFVGTLWTGACAACNGGTGQTFSLVFNPDGVVRGFGTIDTNSTGELIGTWQASTASSGGASFVLVSAPASNNGADSLDGTYLQGTLSATSGTAQIYNSSGAAQGSSLGLTESSVPTNTNTAYLGAWRLSLIDTGPGAVSGGAQSIFAIFEANGDWYLSAAKNASVGTWDPGTGIGSLQVSGDTPTSTCGVQNPDMLTLSVNLAAGTATLTYSSTGVTRGSGTIAPTGLGSAEILDDFSDNEGTLADAAAEVDIPLSLNVDVSWPANTVGSGATASLVLGVALTGPGNVGDSCSQSSATKLEAFGLRPEINSLGNGAAAGVTTDTITFGYIKTQAANYQVSVLGPQAQYCSITQNGSGLIVDANSGNASAYPTVQVVCSQ